MNQGEKYERLQQQFNDLVQQAQDNQTILENYQSFEQQLLSAKDLSDLITLLLTTSNVHFNLSDSRLIWLDDDQLLRSMLPTDVREQFGHRLLFSGMDDDVHELFEHRDLPILKCLSSSEKVRWFPGNTVIESAAFIPLICRGQLIGCLNLASSEKKRFSCDKAVDFMAHMGFISAICLQNMCAQEQVRQLSLLDNLTKVKNRRAFDQDLHIEIARSHRTQEPLSCLFLDADFFKRINDNYGHQTGDEALCCLAQWAQTQLRETDHIARFGGEEFVILLASCDEHEASDIAERIRHYVATQTLEYEKLRLQMTLSIGVSTFYPQQHQSIATEKIIKSLLAQADAGVYAAKAGGRNRVCFKPFDEVQKAHVG